MKREFDGKKTHVQYRHGERSEAIQHLRWAYWGLLLWIAHVRFASRHDTGWGEV